MIRKYYIHTLQTNPEDTEEEPQNTNSLTISGKQLKLSNKQLSLPRQDEWKTRKDIKHCITKRGSNTEPHKQWEQQ